MSETITRVNADTPKRGALGMEAWPESLLQSTVALVPQASPSEAENYRMSTVGLLSACAKLELAAREAHGHCGPGFADRIRARAQRIWESNAELPRRRTVN